MEVEIIDAVMRIIESKFALAAVLLVFNIVQYRKINKLEDNNREDAEAFRKCVENIASELTNTRVSNEGLMTHISLIANKVLNNSGN